MSLKFRWPFRRKPKPEKRTIRMDVPADMLEELCRLSSRAAAATRGGGQAAARLETYQLWTFLKPLTDKLTAGLPAGSTHETSIDWTYGMAPALVVEAEIPPPKETP